MCNNDAAIVTSSSDFERTTQVLSPFDPEFQYIIVRPRLSAKFAEVRMPRPEPTAALIDGSARARRDRRAAARGNTQLTSATPQATDASTAAAHRWLNAAKQTPSRPGTVQLLRAT